MSREAHVRFCESVAVRSRRATRPAVESFFGASRRRKSVVTSLKLVKQHERKSSIILRCFIIGRGAISTWEILAQSRMSSRWQN